jgi:hypothetical protein
MAPATPSRIDADGGAAGRQTRKFSVLQSLENTQNRERISILSEPAPSASGRIAAAPVQRRRLPRFCW